MKQKKKERARINKKRVIAAGSNLRVFALPVDGDRTFYFMHKIRRNGRTSGSDTESV